MAHEGFNWKQQSLLACILFSSRVQRTPIISFLLYCLFSQLPPPSFALSARSLRNRHHPFPPLSSFPSPYRLAFVRYVLPSSFERFVSRTFPERPRFPSSSRLPRYTPTLPLRVARPCAISLCRSRGNRVSLFIG